MKTRNTKNPNAGSVKSVRNLTKPKMKSVSQTLRPGAMPRTAPVRKSEKSVPAVATTSSPMSNA
jgi:hypothetical protein